MELLAAQCVAHRRKVLCTDSPSLPALSKATPREAERCKSGYCCLAALIDEAGPTTAQRDDKIDTEGIATKPNGIVDPDTNPAQI